VTSDWKEVYRQERRRPGYLIENGKSLTKVDPVPQIQHDLTPPQREKRKAA
jgi:hypothetical protein